MDILIMISAEHGNVWQECFKRLSVLGHVTHVRTIDCPKSGQHLVNAVLKVEDLLRRQRVERPAHTFPATFKPELVIDFTGQFASPDVPVLTVSINGHHDLTSGLASIKTKARQGNVIALLNGTAIASANPMISQQTLFSHNRDELFAAVQALMIHAVARIAAGKVKPIENLSVQPTQNCFLCVYLKDIAIAIGRRLLPLVRPRTRRFYWKTAWRLNDGPGVADTMALEGAPFAVLPDDGERFYADPFVFEYNGRHYVFLEEFLYDRGAGVISAARLEPNGLFTTPSPVLEEDHHLSYPNVFQHEGSIYMLPESGGTGELVLYRTDRFPGGWVREAVLIEGRSINDPTIFQRNGRLWLFATETVGAGSSSDTMVVYSAAQITGPWKPHRLNPVVIDRAGARPGGNIIEKDGRLFLPVQDGSKMYGGGLGLREILQLDDDDAVFGPVIAVADGPAWPGSGIHTLNRAGTLEVVDRAC